MEVAERWFECREVDEGVILIQEPHVDPMIRGNFFLVRGRDRDLLVDGGMGIASVRKELADLFERPVIAVATHRHYDHIGAMHEFEEVLAHPADAPVLREGGKLATLFARDFEESFLELMRESGYEIHEMLIDAYPYEGFDPGAWTIPPAPPTRLVDEGDVIDLGDRRFQVLHLPGHTPGQIGLFEPETGTLFSGDCVYRNPPFLDELPESNIKDYLASMRRLRDLPVRIVHAGHDESFGRDRLLEMIDYYLELRGE
ncbi:MAG: MBL fold metallo-hydrolase [Actinomycetota bacterium]|nr:MAG: MBL fold metallo-hydrolase [Actinomycetota bacterium]